ncbi:MAG: winged helix DNA-binding domain-containing protein [Chloroflexota bacterium]|nr:winged helix DNA-binding domain-containing protein [Chloroflexota bacterium]
MKLKSSIDLKRIEQQRDRIYRRTRALRVRTMDDAARFIDAVGFSLLFASTQGTPALAVTAGASVELPSLFEAVKGRRDAHIDDWDKDSDRVWVWKNDLPAARRAFYGKTLAAGKPVFVSLKMLPYLFAVTAPENVDEAYRRGSLSHEAKRVHDALRAQGPTPTMVLRESVGLDSARYHRALDELQRALVILPVGAIIEQGAWASQIFELAARWFPRQAERARKINVDAARRALVKRYIDTVLAGTVPMIGRVFGWQRDRVNAAVDGLVAREQVRRNQEWIMSHDR